MSARFVTFSSCSGRASQAVTTPPETIPSCTLPIPTAAPGAWGAVPIHTGGNADSKMPCTALGLHLCCTTAAQHTETWSYGMLRALKPRWIQSRSQDFPISESLTKVVHNKYIIMLAFFHILLIRRNIPPLVFWNSPISQLTMLKENQLIFLTWGCKEGHRIYILCLPHPSVPTFFSLLYHSNLGFNSWTGLCGDQYKTAHRRGRLQWITISQNTSTFLFCRPLSFNSSPKVNFSFSSFPHSNARTKAILSPITP